jgi:hypothetical protein
MGILMAKKQTGAASEIEAIGIVFAALKDLEATVQLRVLRYVAEMLGVNLADPPPSARFECAGRGLLSRINDDCPLDATN